MALDTVEGIREYRELLEDQEMDLIAIKRGTMLTLLDTLLGVIDEQDRLLATGKTVGGVQTEPLHKRRKVDSAPDLE